MTDITHLEEQIAHLTRTVEDLSDIVARQETELSLASRRIASDESLGPVPSVFSQIVGASGSLKSNSENV